MQLSDFDYDLPEELIALRPVRPRRSARLLVVDDAKAPDGPFGDHHVSDLPSLLRPGDALIVNTTKVIAARLAGVRRRESTQAEGARIEATLLDRLSPSIWRALARPGKRLAVDDRIGFVSPVDGAAETLWARVVAKGEGGAVDLSFDLAGAELDGAVARFGAPPLPPYIAARRATDADDRSDYQSMFAREAGAVAAPTASLHFDPTLVAALQARGVAFIEVLLHVGAGTFLPVTEEDVSQHRLHAEQGEVTEAAVAAIAEVKARGGRVIAVGTTALRVIETAALAPAGFGAWRGATDLYIKPGHQFRVADGLMTNFHLPRTTLMILVAALVGRKRILSAYAHAVRARYRFYSYGDACLLLPSAYRRETAFVD